MDKLKELIDGHSKWNPLISYINRIEAFKDDGVLILENCKAVVESICKTILSETVGSVNASATTQSLLKSACNKMGCLKNSIDLIRSFETVGSHLSEIRNKYCSTAHGQSMADLSRNSSCIKGALSDFILIIFERLSVFLISVYENEYVAVEKKELAYEDYPKFNESFDQDHEEILIGQNGPYLASEVLFEMDSIAYNTELVGYLES